MAASVFVSDHSGIVSSETIPSLLNNASKLGQGVSRIVYDLGDCVLKLNRGGSQCGSNESEFALWEQVRDTEDAQHFAAVYAIADDGSWMVSEKAFAIFEDLGHDERHERTDVFEWRRIESRLRETYHVGDLHDANVGIRADGSILIVDYAMNPNKGSSAATWSDLQESEQECRCSDCRHAYNNPDGCTDHECNLCRPNGCSCQSFEGCHETCCSYGSCLNNAIQRHVTKTEFGIHNVEMRVCSKHGPRVVVPLIDPNQMCFWSDPLYLLLLHL